MRFFRANVAANIVNEVLAGDKSNDDANKKGDVPLLQAYAYFAYRYDKISDALRALLRAIVIDQKNKKTVKLLADVLKSNNVIQEIAEQVFIINIYVFDSQQYAVVYKDIYIFVFFSIF